MRSYIPGTMSPKYVEALGDWQDDFLASITASPEDTERYRNQDKAFEQHLLERMRANGASRKEH